MGRIAIRTSPDRFKSEYSITGPIWIQYEDQDFPDREWVDFPLIVLTEWAREAARLECSGSRNVRFRFMDGDLAVVLRRDKFDLPDYELCWGRSGRESIVSDTRIKPTELIEEILKIGSDLLEWARLARFSGQDVADLSDSLAALRAT